MLELVDQVAAGDSEMTKRSTDSQTVKVYVARLRSAGRDRARFDQAYDDIMADRRVGAPEAIAIAAEYSGRRFSTRKLAMEGMAKKFVDLVRTTALLEIADKVRVL